MDDAPLTVPRNHDIVTIVIRDHEALVKLLDSISSSETSQWADLFWTLTNELVRHEVAEEIVLYPAVRSCGDEGATSADAGLAQQGDVERLLAGLEQTGIGDSELPEAWTALTDAVKGHVAFEESEVLPLLAQQMTDVERFEAGDRYAQAKKRAPTHPHAHGGLATGPLTAAFDRFRDGMHPGRPRSNRTASP
jgi:hemerythrin superfamily protein